MIENVEEIDHENTEICKNVEERDPQNREICEKRTRVGSHAKV